MATLSLCMIVRDEERFLGNCLDSVKDIVDEIIILDTGSSDRTKEIAQGFGVRVFDFKWCNDFSAARNVSISHATSNWVLVMDADEMLDDSGRKEILKLINDRDNCLKTSIGFKFDQRTYNPKEGAKPTVSAGELKSLFDGYQSHKLVRLFRNSKTTKFRNKVHELVEESLRENGGEIVDSGIVLHHFGLLKKDRLHAKTEEYTDILWKQLEQEPKNPRYNRQVGMAFMEKGKLDLAEKYLLRTLQLDPQFPGILADLGKLFVNKNELTRAVKYFNMAVAVNKKDVSSINNLAVLYMNFGKKDVAQKLLEKALEIEPENKAVLSNVEKLKNQK